MYYNQAQSSQIPNEAFPALKLYYSQAQSSLTAKRGISSTKVYYDQAQSGHDPKRGLSSIKVLLLPSTSRISHPCKRANPDNLILTWALTCRTIGGTRRSITPRSMSLRQASNFDRGSYACMYVYACLIACLPACLPTCSPSLTTPRSDLHKHEIPDP